MTYLAKVRKCDLSKLAYELGEVVPPESRIVDLKRLILNSQSYEEEFAKQLLETLIEEREQTERAERERMEQTAQTEQAERIERERIEDRKRIEDRERIERKEQMVMEFELEKLRIQTTRGNNDTSRSTSNDAHYEIRKLMPKYESKDNDLSFYLILFERQAKRLGLDEDQWAFSLLGLLPYEMTQLIARETEEQSGDYRFVKRLLLKRYKLSPEQFRQKFEKHERSQKGSWRDFAFELRGYFNEWIEGMNVENFDALKDLSVTNQLKKKVPNVLRNHLIDDWTKLNNPDELADKLDEYENVRTEMGPPHWNAKHLIPPSFQQKSARFPNQSEVKETKQGTNVSGQDAARNEISETYPNTLRRMVNRAIRNDKGEPKCFNCNQFGHITRDCPAPRTTLTCRGCGQTGHKERNCTRPKEGLKVANLEVEGLETVPPDVYLKDVKIDNKETVKAMIDTGSSSCLLRESVARRISVDIEPDSTSLYGIGNQTAPAARTVGKTTVDLEIDGIVGREITVFIVNDDAQPYDLLIGRTWTDLPYVSFARIGKNLHIGYSSEFPFANLQEEIKSRRIELRATETVQLESDSINFTSAITDEVKDGYVLFTGVDDACVDSLLEVVDGKTTVPIISAGKGKLRVRKNQCVGRVELLNLDDIVVNLDVAEDSFQTKNEEKREGQDQMKRKRPILPEDINVNHSLTSKERQEILDVVNEYRDCFALGMEELGCTDVTKMDIKEVDGSKPVCLRPYKTTASEREAIREIVREWKDNGIVTETRSPYASPVLLVRKKTGDHRLVVDYRRLNIQTVKDKFPLPRIDDLLEGLRNAKFFTTLDLAHGYLQIPLTDKAKLKTAFITPDDTGQFERMIFGLANAPAEFQRLMHTVLGPLLNKKAFCYLDDVIIPAKDWREMIERLREVLERIRSAKLTLKPSKCEFGRREVEFLGYVISTGGLKPGPRKIKAIEEFPEPKNVHDIRRFLGLTNFFRRFVKDFARKAEPLSRLTKKGSQFEWKEEQRRSFGGLRKDLVEYPVLAHYNPELKTEVHCDASAEGLAGMVLQMDEDCKWRLVYCVSKKTTEAEKMYHSSKLELMAIVWTLDRLRQFLVGIKFTVVTDCQALVYMNAKKTTNPQIARWYNLIQEYDFEIRHKPGEKMAHVDGMSRAPVDDPRDTMEEIVEKNLEVCLTITPEEQILMIQHSDPELRDLIQIFRKDPCDKTVGEQNRINDYSYRRKSGRGARRPNVQRIFFNLPDEKENYEQTKMALDKYFTPHKNVVTERFKFRQRVQKDDESLDNYLISLRELSKSCEFGNLEADMIRDQIIEKCNNNKLKEKLLQQENLTLSKPLILLECASKPKCYRCGLDTHSAQKCGAKKMTCSYCNKLGHLFRACRNRPNQNNNRNHKNFNQTKVKTIQEENKTEVGESSDEYTYYTGAENKEKVQIDGSEINMIIDTGSDRTFISYNKMLELYGHKIMPKLHDTTRAFFAYGQDRPLPCYGYFNAVISWKENSVSEEIYVIDKKVESLLGGKASFELGIIKRVNHVNESMSTNIETLVQEHEHLFHGLGTIKGYSHKVTLKDNYRPIAQRCRRIPYAMVEAVNQELDKMLENGIIEEVHQGSEWVSNIIVVPKRDSEEIRLCIDLREVNKAILRERHPIPTIDNMLHALKGAKVFAKLDAKKGFWQVDLDPQSRPLTTFITHRGCYRFCKVPFGLSSAPEAYQKGMDSILLDLKGVICYLDDVVVYAKDRQELEERLRKVLQRFDKVGIRLNRNKCKFAMEELDILGHIVSSEGIKPDNRKIEAVLNFPIPKNIEMLRNCPICVRNQPLINDQPLQIVPLPSKPWMKLGIDIVGPIGHHYVLTVIDYYSSYPEAMIIEDISSKTIIKKLMEIFARHGYPHEVVTDNGLQFVSTSMERFLKECGIRHLKASPYYPKSNGKIERFHRFLKKQFNSSSEEGKDWKEDLSRILMSYRTTPNRSTGKTPAFLLFSREIKTKLSSLVNDAEEDESNIKEFNMVYKEKMKTYNDIIRKASPHNFEIGNLVYVANPNNGKLDSNFRSEHHVILENTSINSFKLVNTKNGKIIHRNAKHLKHVPTQETNQGISDLIPEESQENLSSDSTRIEHLNSSDVQIPDDNSSNQDKDTSLNRPSSSRTGSTFNPVVSDRLDAEALHQLPPEILGYSSLSAPHSARQELEVATSTQPFLTINTHKGLFRFRKMPFGLANAPSYFQSVMDRVLAGIEGVICYIDDVLIATVSVEKHLAVLKTVFLRLEKYNIKLKKDKCKFVQREIEYLGHLIKEDGIRPLDHKVQALQKAKSPTNISELKSFLGLVNYNGKFIPNLPDLLRPLHELLHKKNCWSWTKECEEAIEKCKSSITSERVLVPYDTTLPLFLATDASQIGIGAVLSHVIGGQERPIMFASGTLSGAERNYSQIEWEALAIIYGVTKFHQFIYGRRFTLITDQKPLVSILGPKSGIPTLSTSRLQKWAIILSAYTYDIKFKKTQDHGNADLLSRFPVESGETSRLDNIYALSYMEDLPITAEEIRIETQKDEVLSIVKCYTQHGWPERVPDHLRPYFQRKLELTVDGECLLWGMRVIIPSSLRPNLLSCLHETLSGMSKMKSVARSHFWWPNLDNEIEFLSNGLAERAVKMIKIALVKNKRKPGDTIQDTLSKILLAYRSTPHETTKKAPSELFIGRSLRTRLSIIHPNLETRVKEQQARQMKYDHGFQQDEFGIDDMVWCRNFRGGDRWIPGRIVGRKGSRVNTVLIHGQVKSYHRDQIRKRWENGGDEDRQYGRQREETDIIVPEADMPNRGRSESPLIETARQQRDSGLVDQNDGGISGESSRSPDPEA
ncbi:hypothetical protein LAZ67_3001165, partial [Cordylochernes scorpioides]